MNKHAGISSVEVREFASAMDGLFREFLTTAHRVRESMPAAKGRLLAEDGWPPQMAGAFDEFNTGILTRAELTAAVAKAILLSQNQIKL